MCDVCWLWVMFHETWKHETHHYTVQSTWLNCTFPYLLRFYLNLWPFVQVYMKTVFCIAFPTQVWALANCSKFHTKLLELVHIAINIRLCFQKSQDFIMNFSVFDLERFQLDLVYHLYDTAALSLSLYATTHTKTWHKKSSIQEITQPLEVYG